jgi:hypothetical protein
MEMTGFGGRRGAAARFLDVICTGILRKFDAGCLAQSTGACVLLIAAAQPLGHAGPRTIFRNG